MDFQEFRIKYQKEDVEHYPHNVNFSPVVSVLIQAFQHEKFLKKCLDNILRQVSDFPFEILLGEDCSTDSTRQICIEYAKKYPEKIRLFLHRPENKIQVLNITTGNFNALYNFFSARGEFIAFCEGDDLWTDPYKLQKQVDLLRSKSALALTYHSYLEINEMGQPLPEEVILEQPAQDINKEDLKRLTYHPLLSTICFRNCIQDNIPHEMAEVINVDSFLISLLGKHGAAGFLDNVKPSFYRRHSGGMWTGKTKELGFLSKLCTYHNLITYYTSKRSNQTAKALREKRKKIIYQLLFYYFRKRKFKSAVNFLIDGQIHH